MLPDDIRVILFDLDGTLVDTVGIIVDAVSQTVRRHGIEPDMDAIRRGIGQPLDMTLAPFVPEDLLPQVYKDYSTLYRKVGYEDLRLFPGVTEGLEKLRGNYMLGIVTGKRLEGTFRTLDHVGLSDVFEVIVGADSTDRGKPYPDPILHAVEQLGVAPAEALYIGDAVHDIHAAKNAGSLSAAVLSGAATEEELRALEPNFVYPTVSEFITDVLV